MQIDRDCKKELTGELTSEILLHLTWFTHGNTRLLPQQKA